MQRWSVQQLPVPPEDIESVFRQLHDEALTKFTDQGVDVSSVTIERSMRMRFSMQIHDVEVPVRGQSIDETGLARIESDFELIHDQLFGAGSGDKSSGIDITAIQVRAVAHSVKPSVSLGSDTATPPGSRQVYWSELREHVETQIFSHVPTEPIEGPALIELSDTVIVVRPGHRGVLDGHGNFVIDLQVRS